MGFVEGRSDSTMMEKGHRLLGSMEWAGGRESDTRICGRDAIR